MEKSLFRSEVHSSSGSGELLLRHPRMNWALALISSAVGIVFMWILLSMDYTRKTSVTGIIESTSAVVKVFSPQAGSAINLLVREGELVRKGQVLLYASSEKRDAAGNSMPEQLNKQAHRKIGNLRLELEDTMQLNDQEIATAKESLFAFERQRDSLQRQIQVQELRMHTASENVKTYEKLKASGFVSENQVSQQSVELMEQQMRYDAANKDLMALEGEIKRLQREQTSLAIKRNISKTQLEQNISSAESEVSQTAAEQSWSVVAPVDGFVSGIDISTGQSTASGTPLMAIITRDGNLQAKLFASGKNLGFLRENAAVTLRVDAFPYQKFGSIKGHIVSIADVPVFPNELTSNWQVLPKNIQQGEPLFPIIVKLDSDFILAYGHKERLRSGFQIQAQITQERRKIYEWLVEPLLISYNPPQ